MTRFISVKDGDVTDPSIWKEDRDYEIIPVTDVSLDCRYYCTDEDQFSNPEPWCSRFQITPLCKGDINRCDVGFYAPDPRDGYV